MRFGVILQSKENPRGGKRYLASGGGKEGVETRDRKNAEAEQRFSSSAKRGPKIKGCARDWKNTKEQSRKRRQPFNKKAREHSKRKEKVLKKKAGGR